MAVRPTNLEPKIALAALKLAARKSWHDMTLEQIAQAGKIPVGQLKKYVLDTEDVLPMVVRLIDAEMAAAVGKINRRVPAHDRLFEVMMARFDALQAHRAGILAMAKACRESPGLLRPLLKAQWTATQGSLRLAGLLEDGLVGLAQTAGLQVIYDLVFLRWSQDTTSDMAPTMAALDRALKRAGQVADLLLQKR